jgi:phosphoglucosamine mutase
MGVDVLLVGPMPTPAIAHLTKSLNADAGIVISASHNPAHENGIKFFDKDGFKLSDLVEEKIEKLVKSTEIISTNIVGDLIGKAYRIDDAQGRYIEFAKSSIKSMSLSGLKIVLDCANGAAYDVAPKIFKELGAEVIVLNNKPNGLNINLNCGALYPHVIQQGVKKYNADIGIALDGDADRVIVCDELGNDVNGDHILAILCLDLKSKNKLNKDTVVVTQMTNKGFELAMADKGIKVIRTKVGDRYVVEEMKTNDYILGGEQSGHIILLSHSTTGDGIITALQLLRVMKQSAKPLSLLTKCMISLPQVLVNIKVREKRDFSSMPAVQDLIARATKRLGTNGRLLVRYSGTENIARVMVEGNNKAEITEIANKIADKIRSELG